MAKKISYDAIKLQKRTIETFYSKQELEKTRKSPWGETQKDKKFGLEFEKKEYDQINAFCKEVRIDWFASAWDIKILNFLDKYCCEYNKVVSQ